MSRGRTKRVNTDPREPIPWRVLQDKRISYRARGVLCYLLSLPDGWEASVERVAKESTEGRDAVATALRELEDVGYLARRKYQAAGGKWDWVWLYSDTPEDLAARTEAELAAVSAPNLSKTEDGLSVDGFPVDGATSGNDASPQVGPSTGFPSAVHPSTDFQGTKKELSTGERKEQKISSSRRSATSEERRDDVELLCQRLYDRVTANGSQAEITEGWRDAARLMLDRDGRELDKALNLIDWAAQDPFWCSNILSMPKFRKQYDQLRLKARADWQRQQQAQSANQANGLPSTGSKRVDKARRFRAQAEALMAERERQQALTGHPGLIAIEGGMSA